MTWKTKLRKVVTQLVMLWRKKIIIEAEREKKTMWERIQREKDGRTILLWSGIAC